MRGFIRHSLDCAQILERIEVSHPAMLVQPDDGYMWTEVPIPATAWSVFLGADGVDVVPFARSAVAQLAAAQITKSDQVEALLGRCFAAGYRVVGTGTAMDGERLQVRDDTDRTNWLTSKSTYQDAVNAGLGAVDGALFRTASNNTFLLSFEKGLAVLNDMGAWGFAIMRTSWAHKDAIAAAVDQMALDAVDIESGWPS